MSLALSVAMAMCGAREKKAPPESSRAKATTRMARRLQKPISLANIRSARWVEAGAVTLVLTDKIQFLEPRRADLSGSASADLSGDTRPIHYLDTDCRDDTRLQYHVWATG